jgi:putative transposon-encoded protein
MKELEGTVEEKKRRKAPRPDAVPLPPETHDATLLETTHAGQAEIKIFGYELIEKRVKSCANSGRVYLPPEWIGRRVKIIRVD